MLRTGLGSASLSKRSENRSGEHFSCEKCTLRHFPGLPDGVSRLRHSLRSLGSCAEGATSPVESVSDGAAVPAGTFQNFGSEPVLRRCSSLSSAIPLSLISAGNPGLAAPSEWSWCRFGAQAPSLAPPPSQRWPCQKKAFFWQPAKAGHVPVTSWRNGGSAATQEVSFFFGEDVCFGRRQPRGGTPPLLLLYRVRYDFYTCSAKKSGASSPGKEKGY